MVCSQCENTSLSPHGGSCPECGRTLIRNLADSASLRRALASVNVMTQTPPPTLAIPGLCFDLPPRQPQDTDAHFAGIQDTNVDLPKPVIPQPNMPVVPGYVIERVLGRGGMGTVYLARQLSLDRPVALKLMSRKWASDATFVARFTREAYAAARLSHPNLTQVYDIGEVDGQRFFSMEFVDGRSLAEIVRAAGKLDPETAVGYILQAARGLRHAHDRGMIHRDIKPDNLLLDGQGLIKVADLGLVKTPELSREADSTVSDDGNSGLYNLPLDMTGARMALGTPAYMSPEQCRDAAAVDHRADIYSLGCTLYACVTGRQPFDGDTAVELMTKHAYTPLVPPEEIAARVPRELSTIIQKMMAKNPIDRYPTMGEVVRVLEQWLGVHHADGSRVSAGEDQIRAFEACVDQFQHAPSAILRGRLLTGFFTSALFAALLLTFVGRLGWAFGLAGLILQATLVYFPLNGYARKTYLFRRVRQVVAGSSFGDWLVALAMFMLFAILLWMLKLFWVWVGFGMIGAAFAFALRFGLDRAADAERFIPIAACEKLLRRLRVLGLDENQVRFFVAKYAGRDWEEFFEALFGYEAKLEARTRLLRGESAGERNHYAPWREPLISLLDRIEAARRSRAERDMLVKVEQDRLRATGMTEWAARQKAEQTANAILRRAADLQTAESHRGLKAITTLQATMSGQSKESINLQRLLDDLPIIERPQDRFQQATSFAVGPLVRGTLAIVALILFGLWTIQNNVFSIVAGDGILPLSAEPLEVHGVPPQFTHWVDNANIGVASVLLLTSLLYRGTRMGLLVLVGATVATVAHRFGIPAVEPVRDYHVGLMLGTVIALVGYRFGQR